MADNPTQTPPAQTPAAANTGTPQGNTIEMETKNFNATAIAGYVAEGKRAGYEEGRQSEIARMKAVADACPGNPQLAIDSFLSGQAPEAVKIAHNAAIQARAAADKELRESKERHELEVARLNALLATGGHSGVLLSMTGDADDRPMLEPKAQAEHEWNSQPARRQGFSSKERYINYRTAELEGRFQKIQGVPQHA